PEAIEWVKMQYISKVKAIALRTLRAIEIAVVEVHDDEYVVCNQKNGHHYVVRPFHPNPKERCECADCHFRGAKCKHQIAVEQFIRSQTAQSQVLVA
ncbi:MAG: hypothetical protein SAK29_40945, partial [Scytonema sp. PMC 1069.18]|nr:hypothetical protein [Scytonema sp. PMC 1069.18]MEC4884815.1 hypothetical protein [Scytonema sp. PMC 1070.18]